MMPSPNDAVIVSICRTPLTRRVKPPSPSPTSETLLTSVISSSISRCNLPPSSIQDVCIGNVLGGSAAAVTARVAVIKTLGYKVPVRTTNRQCASGLQAVSDVACLIRSGQIECGLAVGYECMSTNTMENSFGDGPDVEEDDGDDDEANFESESLDAIMTPMGQTSENVAAKFDISREEQDAFSVSSHRKAAAAWDERRFDYELIPSSPSSPNNPSIKKGSFPDNGIRRDTSRIPTLPPAFSSTGTTTAGNSSQITDGAACVCLMSRRMAESRNLPILAAFVSYAVTGVPPRIMGIGPATAIPAALKVAGKEVSDVDLFEINEAFASQAKYCVDFLKIPEEKVNVNGGAIAMGHPLGCTGARLVVTLVAELGRRGGGLGVVSMCVGTGMGAACVLKVERRNAKSKL
ncbi:hypothetical protein TrST_g6840 [Triparma strigata]|uniref:acetyl-CoA C-acyltransferase n=1 Tax=Triparma strigata TaxID=1606541 RepID=A0A9W7DSJ7_9STRA|nr:hypothetical protein TrST_g6840 [Triparma strigata]